MMRFRGSRACACLIVLSFAAGPRAAAQPAGEAAQRVEHDWGDLLYGRTYSGAFTFTSACDAEQRVLLSAARLPGLLIASSVVLRPRGSAMVPYRFTPVPPSAAAPLALEGELIVTHDDAGGRCQPTRVVNVIRGRLRAATPEDDSREDAEDARAAAEAACRVWWMSGRQPAGPRTDLPPAAERAVEGLTDAACAAIIRPIAEALRQQVAAEEAAKAPAAWNWLPDAPAVARMSMDQLTAFRQRVAETRKNKKEP